jgi:8-oxo-dGTP diphosphatase
MTEYTLGFAFDLTKRFVVLIEKKHPAWLAGKLNGVGGKVNKDDSSITDCMRREFEEEAGVDISDWSMFARLRGNGYRVCCYRAFTDLALEARTTTDEEIHKLPVDKLQLLPVIGNLAYLIPLALDLSQVGIVDFDYVSTWI